MLVPPGVLIDGKYEIRSTIGSGGMGVVYEAYHLSLERVVAVKMLTASTSVNDNDCQRFEREALILSRLSHPNIVQFYAYGIWRSVPYLVIERVSGTSLQNLLAKNQPLEVPLALDIARQVCDGLQHAHASDILHRDLKPGNVIIVDAAGQRPHVKIIDFGLAKLIGPDRFQKLTQTGMALGSFMYASPEQCMGQSVDACSDIYSLGCTLYEMVTGYPPFTADNATAVMFQQLNESVGSTDHWSEVPAELQPVLAKCMAKEQSRRYSSAEALEEDLGKVLEGRSAELEGDPVSAAAAYRGVSNPFPSAGRLASSAGMNFLIVALTSVALCAMVIGVFLSLRRSTAEPVQEATTPDLVRDQLYQLVHTTRTKECDEATTKRLFDLIDQYRRDRSFALDHTNLIQKAYGLAMEPYYKKGDFASLRPRIKQALEDCRWTSEADCSQYLGFVQMYHEACEPVNCHLSLIPMLQDVLKRYPKADEQVRLQLYLALGKDYFQLKQFDSARQAASQAASIAESDAEKQKSKHLLDKCNREQREFSAR